MHSFLSTPVPMWQLLLILGFALAYVCLISYMVTDQARFYEKLWQEQFQYNGKLFRELQSYKSGENWKDETYE